MQLLYQRVGQVTQLGRVPHGRSSHWAVRRTGAAQWGRAPHGRGSAGDDGVVSSPSPSPSPPVLALLNGPPGVGKSTLAAALARRHPDLRALDVDVVKHDLDSWPSDPRGAGLRARELILDQARVELGAGRGVIIGQYLARPEFPAALAELAERESARFTHVLLELPVADLERRLRDRRRSPTRPEQATNDARVEPAQAEQLIASLEALTRAADHVLRIDASGDLASTLSRLERAVLAR